MFTHKADKVAIAKSYLGKGEQILYSSQKIVPLHLVEFLIIRRLMPWIFLKRLNRLIIYDSILRYWGSKNHTLQ